MPNGTRREFRAGVEALESRVVPGGVHYHLVPVVGRGVATQTSKVNASTGGYTIVDVLNGQSSDLGRFSGAVLFTVSSTGAITSGRGALYTNPHNYELAFNLTGAVRITSRSPLTAETDLIFQVVGGTKRFAFASGQGQIVWSQQARTAHPVFRIDGFVNQLK